MEARRVSCEYFGEKRWRNALPSRWKNPPDGKCVAVFADRLAGPAYLEVFDPFGNLAQRLSKLP